MTTRFLVILIAHIVIKGCVADKMEDGIVSCNSSIGDTFVELLCSCTVFNHKAALEGWPKVRYRVGDACNETTLPNCVKNVTLRIKNCPWPNDLSYYYQQVSIDPQLISHFDFYLHPAMERQEIFVTDTSLQHLSQLRFLNLELRDVSKLSKNALHNAKFLEEIDLSRNYLWNLDEQLFRENTKLRKIDLSDNHITELSNSIFSSTRYVKSLNLSYNFLSRINRFVFSQLTFLEYLYLQQNHLQYVNENAFNGLLHLKLIDLSHNQIFFSINFCPGTLSQNGMYYLLANMATFTDNAHVDLTFNNITEVSLSSISKACEHDRCKKLTVSLHNNPLTCSCGVYDLIKYFHNQSVPHVYKSIRIDKMPSCAISENQRIPLSSVDITKIFCNLKDCKSCPRSCNCEFYKNIDKVIVKCDNVGLKNMPTVLPENISDVELWIRNNSLQVLYDNIPQYPFISTFSASHNEIKNLSDVKLLKFGKLKVLELDNNELEFLSRGTVSQLKYLNLTKLTLGNNPWKCEDCRIKDLIDFLQNAVIVYDVNLMKCSGSDKLVKHHKAESCNNNRSNSIVWLLLVLASVVAAIFMLAYLLHKYRTKLPISWPRTLEIEMHDKIYDAFISYAHEDESFVAELVNKLEKRPDAYKICLHSRNWKPGEFIVKQMVESIKQSRSTIIVLTMAYTKSEWCSAEFQLALTQMLVRKNHKLIVLWCPEEDPDELELECGFKSYLQMCTYLKVDDKNFLPKLESAIDRVEM